MSRIGTAWKEMDERMPSSNERAAYYCIQTSLAIETAPPFLYQSPRAEKVVPRR